LTADEKRAYLREIKKDMTYFERTYARAHLRVDMAGLDVEAAARRMQEAVEELAEKAASGSEGGESEPGLRADGASRGSSSP
jgi:shikimate kinase